MNDDEIRNLVEELDKEVSKENANVKFEIYGGGPDESQIFATKEGYLRLGIEFLKGAYSKSGLVKGQPDSIEIDIDYLLNDSSDIFFDYYERNNKIEQMKYTQTFKDKMVGSIVLIVVIVFCLFALIGAYTTIEWIIS